MSNDAQIKQLRATIDSKRGELGDKPKVAYTTNALLTIDGTKVNLNTLSLDQCVDVASRLLAMTHFNDEANKRLGTDIKIKLGDFTVDQWISDLKLRVELLTWEDEKKKLATLDKQLASLLSEDARTADALADIAAQLAPPGGTKL